MTVTLAFHTYEHHEEDPVSWDFDEETGERFEVKHGVKVEDDSDNEEDKAAAYEDIGSLKSVLRNIQTKTK